MFNRPISTYENSVSNDRPQNEALGNKPHKLCIYSPEPRTEVYCLRLNFDISKLVYYHSLIPWGSFRGRQEEKGTISGSGSFRGLCRRQDVVRTSVPRPMTIASCATFLFLPHFDVICDLLLNRRTSQGIYLLNKCTAGKNRAPVSRM